MKLFFPGPGFFVKTAVAAFLTVFAASALTSESASAQTEPPPAVTPDFEVGSLENPTAVHIQRTMKMLEESTTENPATVRVLFYGQSIVAQGWRKIVETKLRAKYPTVNFVFSCRAIGGFTSTRLVRTAWSDLYPFYPDLLFFHVYGPMEKYEEIVRTVREKTTAEIVLWSSHLCNGEDPVKKLAKRDKRTLAIRDVARRHKCMFIDLNKKWCEMLIANKWPAGRLLSDNIHLSGKAGGLAYYARFIGEEIRRVPGARGEDEVSGRIVERPIQDGRTVQIDADGTVRLLFYGNRVVAVSDGEGASPSGMRAPLADVFLDGRPVASYPEMWTCTRPSALVSWMPMIKRVSFDVPPVEEDWTLTFLEGTDLWGDPVRFKVEGSVTGFDGEGWTTNDFRSLSGRVAIQESDYLIAWQYDYFVRKKAEKNPKAVSGAAKPGRRIRWKTLPLFESPLISKKAGERTVLVQNCANAPHVLEIRPRKGVKRLGIGKFIVFTPPTGGQKALDARLAAARAELARGESSVKATYARLWEEARAADAVYAPVAAKAYAQVLERFGERAAADDVRTDAAVRARPYQRPELEGREVPPAAVCTFRPPRAPAVAFHVAPGGDDCASGGAAAPFATLERARDAVRALKRRGALPSGGVAVLLHDGVYRMTKTLALGPEDSGEEGAPVVWRARKGAHAVLSGAIEIPRFDAVGDEAVLRRLSPGARRAVVCADVSACGFTDTAPCADAGFYCGEVGGGSPLTDLYADGERLQPARWPDTGWLEIGNVLDESGEKTFEADFDLTPWAAEPSLKVSGYWRRFWADFTCTPAKIDPAARTVSLGRQAPGGCHVLPGHPWYFLDAACALSRPGEWWLDRPRGKLYVWPVASARRYTLSAFDKPFITVTNAHHLAFVGLVMEGGRWSAVRASGCADFLFGGNVVRGFGGEGVVLRNMRNTAVTGNVLRDFGQGALRISGGDRRTLTSGGIVVADNDISRTGRWKRTYAPGLHLSGCGTEVACNHFHDMPSSALRLEGNDHRVVSNVVERVVTESDDQGGLDIYANPAYAGIYIAFNIWRDIGCGGRYVPCGQGAVRLDDAVSSMTVHGNYFENCAHRIFGCVQLNGGRNNIIDNNIFVSDTKGVSVGGWTDRRWRRYLSAPGVERQIRQLTPVDRPPYRDKYPGIDRLLETGPLNYLTRNVVVGKGAVFSGSPETVWYANRRFEKMPTAEQLAEEPSFRPLPPPAAIGPREGSLLRFARARDALINRGTVALFKCPRIGCRADKFQKERMKP